MACLACPELEALFKLQDAEKDLSRRVGEVCV